MQRRFSKIGWVYGLIVLCFLAVVIVFVFMIESRTHTPLVHPHVTIERIIITTEKDRSLRCTAIVHIDDQYPHIDYPCMDELRRGDVVTVYQYRGRFLTTWEIVKE